LVATGDAESVLNAVDVLPGHVRDAHARIAGDAHMLRGDWDEALAAFRHAGSDDDAIDAGIAWRVGSIHLGRGDPARAVEIFDRALVDGTDPKQEALLLSWRAQASFMRGEMDACAEHAERSLALAGQAQDDLALAAAHTASGLAAALRRDHAAENRHWHRALDCAEKVRDVQWIIRIRNHRATRGVLEDAYDRALSDIEVVLDLSEATGSGAGAALALTTRGAIRFMQGALEESIADLRSAAATFERRSSSVAAYPLRLLADVLCVRGSLVPALAAYERALEIADAAGSVSTVDMVLAALSNAIVEDRPDEASAHIERALSHGTATRNWYVQAAAARVSLARGEREDARRIAQRAVEIAREQGPAQVAETLELMAASGDDPAENRTMLDEALAMWTNIGHPLGEARVELALARLAGGSEARERAERAERGLRMLGARPLARQAVELLAALDREALPSVAITTLGGFGVERDGARIPLAEWRSRKARDLLKMLVAKRGRPTSRDVLIDTLWPGEDPAKASNRFSVALSTLRSVLDPDKRFSADQVIVADSASAALSVDDVAVDVERFLADASRGLDLRRAGRPEEAMPFLLSAEALYAGDFLEEDLYEDWAVGLREEANAAYVAVARALSEEASLNGDEDAAVRYLLRILERDRYDERAHLELVASLERAERHGEARRRYRAYCSSMDEIGVESAPFPSQSVARAQASAGI
jgi:DNA-binding SARP family transcriptional activator/predicted negative regulator of RcsB-dependent stress response